MINRCFYEQNPASCEKPNTKILNLGTHCNTTLGYSEVNQVK